MEVGEPSRHLEQDLYLAAELGKTLLEQNREMEDSLQEMYLTNEEQMQEIEYLSKQLEMLREMNEQHAKVYEQLDSSAHKLEETNQSLLLEARCSQEKIDRLTGTMQTLQTQVDTLTGQVEELRSLEQLRMHSQRRERPRSVHSFSCMEELTDAHSPARSDGERCTPQSFRPSLEEENGRLRELLVSLQSASCAERARREAAERECALTLRVSAQLEQRLLLAHGCQRHLQELEAELQELRELRGEGAEPGKEASAAVHKSRSDTALTSMAATNGPGRGQGSYTLRGGASAGQGVSILREVDEQYHALLEKYEELLGRCRRREDSLQHAEVQTSRPVSRELSARDCSALAAPTPAAESTDRGGDGQAEYKALFKEIFSHIQKTKSDVKPVKTRKAKK